MNDAKKQMLAAIAVLLIFLTSCRKDVITPENQLLQSDVVSSDITANDVVETALPVHTPITTYVNGNCAGYYQTLPARYNLTTKTYPLIIFIHGIGELGTGVTRLNCCGVPNYAKNGKLPPTYAVNGVKYSPIYISPQFKVRPTAADVQSVINYAVNKYRVDRTRIYVTGLSMGGGSTLDYSVADGQNITAIAEVCGGTKPTTSMAKSLASKNIPVWGIYSDGDQVVPVQWGKDWISWIKSSNSGNASNVKLTVYSGLSHNSTWSRAFNPVTRTDGYNIYEWLLRFKKGSVPAGGATPAPPPTSSGNRAPIAAGGADQKISLAYRKDAFLNGAASKDTDGWLNKYTWTKISGPAATVVADGYKAVTSAHARYLVVGTYTFRLTVTDNKGATGYDDVKVTVTK